MASSTRSMIFAHMMVARWTRASSRAPKSSARGMGHASTCALARSGSCRRTNRLRPTTYDWRARPSRSDWSTEMATEDLSREIILDHYQNPRNHGRLAEPTVANRGHNPLCGDEIELSIGIDEGQDRITEIAFTGRGCSISQASASMMTDVVKGHTLDEAEAAVQNFTQRMAN